MIPTNRKNGRLLASLVLMLALGLAACGAGSAGVPASGLGIEQAAAPAMGVSPSTRTVKVGETFDAIIFIKTKDPVRAAGCALSWSGSGKIEATGKVDEGEFFKASGKTLKIGGNYDAASGTSGQVAVSSLAASGVSGEGAVLVFHFKAVSPGQVDLKVSDLQVTNLSDQEIKTFIKCDGKVIVQ